MGRFGDFFTDGDENRVGEVNLTTNTMGPYPEVIVPNIRRHELPDLFVVTRIGERRSQLCLKLHLNRIASGSDMT